MSVFRFPLLKPTVYVTVISQSVMSVLLGQITEIRKLAAKNYYKGKGYKNYFHFLDFPKEVYPRLSSNQGNVWFYKQSWQGNLANLKRFDRVLTFRGWQFVGANQGKIN